VIGSTTSNSVDFAADTCVESGGFTIGGEIWGSLSSSVFNETDRSIGFLTIGFTLPGVIGGVEIFPDGVFGTITGNLIPATGPFGRTFVVLLGAEITLGGCLKGSGLIGVTLTTDSRLFTLFPLWCPFATGALVSEGGRVDTGGGKPEGNTRRSAPCEFSIEGVLATGSWLSGALGVIIFYI